MQHDPQLEPAQGDAAPRSVTRPRPAWKLLVIALPALAAALVSGYLLTTSLVGGGGPVGCGSGSGCSEVLSSRWSRVAGVPVSLPAVAVYLLVLAAAVAATRARQKRTQHGASIVLWCAAGAILTAASWFVALQWFDLGVFCPWCLVDHGLGVATALGILTVETRERRFRPGSFSAGLGLAALLAGLQVFGPVNGPAVAELNPEQRRALEGSLSLDDAPRLGPADAPQRLVVLFDYCCPHCRETHRQLLEGLARAPGEVGLVLLPMPLSHECNPYETETEPRFADSCALARLALAVWRAAPEQFEAFDRWLFESPQPRPRAAAQAEAERLVGAAELERALHETWIESRLRADVDAYAASGVGQIPVLLAPGRAGISGRAATSTALWDAIDRSLGIRLQ